uniref:Phytanoyl-CoA dioxygenase family protein n=1 Tax=Plectus sambesii TaxID=2011161 RepID=A0A914W4A9_9BILA
MYLKNNFTKESDFDFRFNHNDTDMWPEPTTEMLDSFDQHGFVIVRDLFSPDEMEKMVKSIEGSNEFEKANFAERDVHNRKIVQSNWNVPGEDILGMVARNAKVAGVAEQLTGHGDMYMYTGKVTMKKPKIGGEIVWHQDYGYYYNNHALFPDFINVLIGLTKSDHENGGLQVIKGSHQCGRIDHGKLVGQTHADLDRVNLILKAQGLVEVNLRPGDAIFFHCNLLHRSGVNNSDHRRWNLIFTFNTMRNYHYRVDRKNADMKIEAVEKVPADAVKKVHNLKLQYRDYHVPDGSM